MRSYQAEQVKGEDRIVWLEDVSRLPYVREFNDAYCHFRSRPPGFGFAHCGRMVGYATLRPDIPSRNGLFTRRIFWLKTYDWPNDGPYRNGGWPSEAVDPRSVAAGTPASTPRATEMTRPAGPDVLLASSHATPCLASPGQAMPSLGDARPQHSTTSPTQERHHEH